MGGGRKLIEECRKAGRPIHPDDEAPALKWEVRIWWLYDKVRTQWRRAGNTGVATGLDYGPAIAICRDRRWPVTLALTLLQAIEVTRLDCWNEQHAAEDSTGAA